MKLYMIPGPGTDEFILEPVQTAVGEPSEVLLSFMRSLDNKIGEMLVAIPDAAEKDAILKQMGPFFNPRIYHYHSLDQKYYATMKILAAAVNANYIKDSETCRIPVVEIVSLYYVNKKDSVGILAFTITCQPTPGIYGEGRLILKAFT